MQQLTPLDFLRINVANAFGLDKITWNHRLLFTLTKSMGELWELIDEAKDRELYIQSLLSLQDVYDGKPTGAVIGLDATWSGLQIMGAAIGCRRTCEETNVITTPERKDGYTTVCARMAEKVHHQLNRDDVKQACMTHMYGSVMEPILLFGKDTPELEAFYDTMSELFPGGEELREDLLNCIDKNATSYKWTMPDGHVVYYKVTKYKSAEIEHEGITFLYSSNVNEANKRDVSLLANIVHAFDGWIVRQMIMRSHREGFDILTVHDCFYCSPLYAQRMREMYNELLAEIHEENYMQDILRQVTNDLKLKFNQIEQFGDEIRQANYALS